MSPVPSSRCVVSREPSAVSREPFDKGTGPAIVVVPGLQGRWEWMTPGLDALARHGRTLCASLADEPSSGAAWSRGDGFDRYVTQVIEVMDRAGVANATICGMSYGGLVALAVAARYPDRVKGLVLASALAPSWTPDERVRRYLAAPTLLFPLFVASSPFRMAPEVRAALPEWGARLRFLAAQTWRIARAPLVPWRAAPRLRELARLHLEADAARVRPPVLVVTGEEALDRVVPVAISRQYLALCPGARAVTLARTGHIGIVTAPERFAEIVGTFARDAQGWTARTDRS